MRDVGDREPVAGGEPALRRCAVQHAEDPLDHSRARPALAFFCGARGDLATNPLVLIAAAAKGYDVGLHGGTISLIAADDAGA
jgi:hypothetical protein